MPVYIAPCALLPPFNTIHADDLSKWTGEANDPVWIRLVDRIAKPIGREGVAAAARVLATGDDQARYDFARRYPDEPTARKIWSAAEARQREHFARRMAEAKSAAEAKIKAERALLEARLKAAAPAFEAWLADERRAAAKGPRPDPLDVIEAHERDEHADHGEEQRLRDQIAALYGDLEEAKARGRDLDAAKAEIARLSSELAPLQSAVARAKAQESDLDRAKAEVARLSKE